MEAALQKNGGEEAEKKREETVRNSASSCRLSGFVLFGIFCYYYYKYTSDLFFN